MKRKKSIKDKLHIKMKTDSQRTAETLATECNFWAMGVQFSAPPPPPPSFPGYVYHISRLSSYMQVELNECMIIIILIKSIT